MNYPQMSRMLVSFVHRIISMFRHCIRIALYRSPEVCYETIQVVDRLYPWVRQASEQHSSTAKERLYIIRAISETIPYQMSYFGFSTEPWKRSFDRIGCHIFNMLQVYVNPRRLSTRFLASSKSSALVRSAAFSSPAACLGVLDSFRPM